MLMLLFESHSQKDFTPSSVYYVCMEINDQVANGYISDLHL